MVCSNSTQFIGPILIYALSNLNLNRCINLTVKFLFQNHVLEDKFSLKLANMITFQTKIANLYLVYKYWTNVYVTYLSVKVMKTNPI